MKKDMRVAVGTVWLLVLGYGTPLLQAQDAPERPRSREELRRLADSLKPEPGDLKWMGIPWTHSLVEAQKMARQERRPIFLWVLGTVGGQLMEGC